MTGLESFLTGWAVKSMCIIVLISLMMLAWFYCTGTLPMNYADGCLIGGLSGFLVEIGQIFWNRV